MSFVATALSGLGLLFDVSFGAGYGALLRTVTIFRCGSKATLSYPVSACKPKRKEVPFP
jgi:hypothetical protein